MKSYLAVVLAAAFLDACSAPEDDHAGAGDTAAVSVEDTLDPEADQDAVEAENWRKLGEIPEPPADTKPEQTDERWFVLATKEGRCSLISDGIPAETPREVLRLFAANGTPLEIVADKGEYVRVRLVGVSSDPGMAFVQGEKLCDAYMAYAKTVE